MDFHYFMAVINEIVEKKVDDPRGKLTCTSTSTPQMMQRKW